jgi:hypothetical protein
MQVIRRTFRCLSSPSKKIRSLGATDGRAVFQPLDDDAQAINGRVFRPADRLVAEVADGEMFTEGRKYEVEIREV